MATIQLPPDAAGTAAGVLAYSWISVFAGVWMMYLLWVHHERKSYVMLMCVSGLISTFASIVQQWHTIARWRDIKVEQHAYFFANPGKPEIVVAGASYGLDLVMFYLQWYGYNATALLTVSWAVTMTRSVYEVFGVQWLKGTSDKVAIIAKAFSFIFPVFIIGLLHAPSISGSLVAFLVVADLSLFFALFVGSLCMLLILVKYIYTRHRMLSWKIPYGRGSAGTKGTNPVASGNHDSSEAPAPKRESFYDRWLLIRFTVAFCCLSAFQLTTILFQLAQYSAMAGLDPSSSTSSDNLPPADVSAGRAKGDFYLFMPGVTSCILTLVVFGTTRPFRRTMYKTLVPARFRRDDDDNTAQRQQQNTAVMRAPRVDRTFQLHTNKDPAHTDGEDASVDAIMLDTLDTKQLVKKQTSLA